MDRIATWPVALGVAAIMGVLGLAGVGIAAAVQMKGRVWLRRALGFASGFMFAFALLEILPEAMSQAQAAPIAAVVGFAAFYAIERLFDIHLCPAGHDECAVVHEHAHSEAPVGTLAILGLGVHAIIDGLAIGGALTVSTQLAILVFLAVALHKLPDGFCMGSLMGAQSQGGGIRWGPSLVFAGATPVGVLVGYAGLAGASGTAIGLTLGFAAGSFLYVAAADLLPEAHTGLRNRADRWAAMAAVVSGTVLAVLVTSVVRG